MRNWLRHFLQKSRQQHPSRPLFFRPSLEGLEERCLLDAGMTMMMPSPMMSPTAMMMTSPMMMSSSMMTSNGMTQMASSALMEAQADAFFQMVDARLISLESILVARMPQLDGLIQSFNAMVTGMETTIAGHPINNLTGKA